MNLKWIKILVFGLLLVFYGSFLVYKIDLPGGLDLPRQMQNGKDILQGSFEVITKNFYSYTEPDRPFANHHWLSGALFYVLYLVIGWNGMIIFKVAVLLLTFAIIFWMTAKSNNFWLVSLCSILSIFILVSRTGLRPEIFSYLFVAVFLFLLMDFQRKPESNKIFLLVPLQLLWVNLHLFFGVGVFMVAGFLAERVVLNFKKLKNDLVIKKLAIVLFLLLIVIFINPFGLKGAIFSLQVNIDRGFPVLPSEMYTMPEAIKENPEFISALLFRPIAILLFLSFILALIFRCKKGQFLFKDNYIFYLLGSLSSVLLVYFIIRAISLFGLIFLPAICANLNEPFRLLREKVYEKIPQFKKEIGKISIAILVFIIVALTIFGHRKIMQFSEQGLGLSAWSMESANFFKKEGLNGPIFNNTSIGSYLIGELYPQEKVFTDNRFGDAYSASFFRDIYLPMIRDEHKWQEGVEKYNFNVIFFYHYDATDGIRDFLKTRFYDPGWPLVYIDRHAAIFIRNNAENKEVIDEFRITNDNLKNKLKYLLDSSYSEDQVAAADIFNMLGRFDLSVPAYLKLISKWPERSKIWMVLGVTELTKTDQTNSNPYLAAIYLERAIKEGQKTWKTYSYLALAYYRTGQLDRARWAVERELKTDPHNADGRKWLELLAEKENK